MDDLIMTTVLYPLWLGNIDADGSTLLSTIYAVVAAVIHANVDIE